MANQINAALDRAEQRRCTSRRDRRSSRALLRRLRLADHAGERRVGARPAAGRRRPRATSLPLPGAGRARRHRPRAGHGCDPAHGDRPAHRDCGRLQDRDERGAASACRCRASPPSSPTIVCHAATSTPPSTWPRSTTPRAPSTPASSTWPSTRDAVVGEAKARAEALAAGLHAGPFVDHAHEPTLRRGRRASRPGLASDVEQFTVSAIDMSDAVIEQLVAGVVGHRRVARRAGRVRVGHADRATGLDRQGLHQPHHRHRAIDDG